MNKQPEKVVFRTYDDGETIALFFEHKDSDGNTKVYSRGSHWFFVEYQRIMRLTRPAVRKEYIALFNELKSIGHKRISVYKRARIKTSYINKNE